MSAKKGKRKVPQPKNQKAVTMDAAESELSAVATVSFIEGLQQNSGAPLHSTALEEDLHTQEKQVQEKSTKQPAKPEREGNKRKPKRTPQRSQKTGPTAAPVGQKKAVKRKSSGDANAARPVKKQKVKGRTKIPEAAPQEQSDGSVGSQSHKDVFTSDEELEESWKPSLKKLKVKGFASRRSRTSSSGQSRRSSSGSGHQPDKGRRRKKVKRSGVTQLEVVLEEFLDFCEQYKQTVESKAVKQALDCFSSNVEDQLTEKISSSKQLKTLMRENSKLASAIRTKRQRLLDAKNELIKSERQLWLLQKDKSELEQNLKDLNLSKTFLQNIRELNTKYLQHRQKHSDEKETYDASSLPALLIEAKHVQTTEHQLKAINNRLQSAIKEK